MARLETPLRSDEGWPYPDGAAEPAADEQIDLDVLELRADPHLYDALTDLERNVLLGRFGLADGRARSMKELSRTHELSHTETREVLESALHKIKQKLEALDEG